MFRFFSKLMANVAIDPRIWLFLLPALAILALDLPVLVTLIYSLAAIGVVVALAHVGRRILLHYVDLDDAAAVAMQGSTGAGLVFFGVMFLVSAMILASAIWISR